MHRARKRLLEEGNGREYKEEYTFNFSKRTARRTFSRVVTLISTRNCLSLRVLVGQYNGA